MTELLFVYGTLKDSAVQQKVLGRNFADNPDTLENYTISPLTQDDGTYFTIVETKNKTVEGIVLDIFKSDFSALDEYEGTEYKRERIKLKSGRTAWVYKKNE